jgi:hypothetical protein
MQPRNMMLSKSMLRYTKTSTLSREWRECHDDMEDKVIWPSSASCIISDDCDAPKFIATQRE